MSEVINSTLGDGVPQEAMSTTCICMDTQNGKLLNTSEKVYFRSQILERPSIGEYWNITGVPVLPENVIFTSF